MLIKKADNVRLFCFYTPPILAKSLILEKIFKCSKIKQFWPQQSEKPVMPSANNLWIVARTIS